MFKSHILQNHNARNVLMLHGLFSSAGFWLPVLHCFPRYRIILLTIDYERFFNSPNGFVELDEYVQGLTVKFGGCDVILGHSLGSVLSARLNSPVERRYHLCPIFAVDNYDLNGLHLDIVDRIGKFSPPISNVISLLRRGLQVAKSVNIQFVLSRNDCFLVPDSDAYFCYMNPLSGANYLSYRGGHFDLNGVIDYLNTI